MERKDIQKKCRRPFFGRLLIGIGTVAACLLSSAGVTALAVRINHAEIGFYLLPFWVSVGVFFFATLGFFFSEEKWEKLYGGCSIAGITCAIVQLALIF